MSDIDVIEEMAHFYFVDRKARVAPNAWAGMPACSCGNVVGPGDRCARCKSTFADLKRGDSR